MKQNFLTKATLFIFTVLLSFSGVSQNSVNAEQLTQEWTLVSTQDGVEIYLKQEKCDVGAEKHFTYAFIRIVNTTTTEKSVEFNFQMQYDNGCYGCGDTRETKKMLAVPASTSVEGENTFQIGELSLLINNPYQLDPGVLESINLDELNIK
jgi:hypothetical protein